MGDKQSSAVNKTRVINKMRAPVGNWDSIGLSRAERELIVACLRSSDVAAEASMQNVLKKIIDVTNGVNSSALCWLRLEDVRNIAAAEIARTDGAAQGQSDREAGE